MRPLLLLLALLHCGCWSVRQWVADGSPGDTQAPTQDLAELDAGDVRTPVPDTADGRGMDAGEVLVDAGHDAGGDRDADGAVDAPVDRVDPVDSSADDAPADVACDARLESDPMNCGFCGHACPSYPHAATACDLWRCALRCDLLWADCDLEISNGCERDVSSDPMNCGNCTGFCPMPNRCVEGVCRSPH